jgi:hypothetical protein
MRCTHAPLCGTSTGPPAKVVAAGQPRRRRLDDAQAGFGWFVFGWFGVASVVNLRERAAQRQARTARKRANAPAPFPRAVLAARPRANLIYQHLYTVKWYVTPVFCRLALGPTPLFLAAPPPSHARMKAAIQIRIPNPTQKLAILSIAAPCPGSTASLRWMLPSVVSYAHDAASFLGEITRASLCYSF